MTYDIVESGALKLAINVLRRMDKNEVASELEAASVRTSDGWIDVRDMKPKHGQTVLVRFPKPKLADEGYWYDVANVYHNTEIDLKIFECKYVSVMITHWKPIE